MPLWRPATPAGANKTVKAISIRSCVTHSEASLYASASAAQLPECSCTRSTRCLSLLAVPRIGITKKWTVPMKCAFSRRTNGTVMNWAHRPSSTRVHIYNISSSSHLRVLQAISKHCLTTQWFFVPRIIHLIIVLDLQMHLQSLAAVLDWL